MLKFSSMLLAAPSPCHHI